MDFYQHMKVIINSVFLLMIFLVQSFPFEEVFRASGKRTLTEEKTKEESKQCSQSQSYNEVRTDVQLSSLAAKNAPPPQKKPPTYSQGVATVEQPVCMNWQVLDRMPFLPQPKRDSSPPRTEPGIFYLLNESVSSNIKLYCIKTVGGYCIDFYDSIEICFQWKYTALKF